MPKPPNVIRPYRLNINIPEDLKVKIDLHLWSEVEGRVPHGAHRAFFIQLANEYFKKIEESQKCQ